MRPQQLERAVVIETCHIPIRIRRAVAFFAICGVPSCRMIQILGSIVITPMTGNAVDRISGKIPVNMAGITCQRSMLRVESNSRARVVVPLDGNPRCCVVTFFALTSQCSAIGIILSSNPVAIEAAVGCALDFTICVAGLTRKGQMLSLQSKGALFVKCSRCVLEASGGVAVAALGAQTASMNIFVTGAALRIQRRIGIILMTIFTLQVCMRSGQSETCTLSVIKLRLGTGILFGFLVFVFGMARNAVCLEISMHAGLIGPLFRNRCVTCEAELREGFPDLLMAAAATIRSAHKRMGLTQRANGLLRCN